MFLSLILAASVSLAGEGFFDKNEIQTPFDLNSVSGASLLLEEINPTVGQFKHIGNAFFISASGHVLTNYHVANTCVRANKDFFKAKYGSIVNLTRQGFLSDDPEGIPCRSLRAVKDAKTGAVYKLQLIALPPIAEQPPSKTPMEANGPYYDLAILKITLDSAETVPAYLKLQEGLSEMVALNEDVYLVGYPAATFRAEDSEMIQQGKYRDVVTGDYRVSLGQVLPMQLDYFYHPKASSFFYTSTDGGPGSSGSALLNKQGSVVGLILGSGDDKASSSTGCIMKLKYCGGVALYLRTNVIIETINNSFPNLGLILF